ncbi:pre-mRNA-splicing regulator female-lethal(2)D-like [Teleopsis dalmanni]|uniref:pre-mRNA-splicing regulator female-lethal(2)D-like n=1 Tax=Teleopsis dalmanni TaxID=139649 RepID=UPI0018CEC508|nr:pre-mRNA-splicing regulator female-lethal(2)D-like [Teleopsis dalmanni]
MLLAQALPLGLKRTNYEEIETLKLEQTRLQQLHSDAQRREKILMRRLANKEQEFQDYVSQIAEYKAAQAPTALALRSALLDPAVNILFEKLKKELKATKAKLEETQNELAAWKFTPDSNTGKRLMAKCRLLYQENEELGKMTSNGRLAKLETELAMQKSFSEEVKKSQSELDDFLQELEDDVEGMQSTILFLQQELKIAKERIDDLEKENIQLKNGVTSNGKELVEDEEIMHRPLIEQNGNSLTDATDASYDYDESEQLQIQQQQHHQQQQQQQQYLQQHHHQQQQHHQQEHQQPEHLQEHHPQEHIHHQHHHLQHPHLQQAHHLHQIQMQQMHTTNVNETKYHIPAPLENIDENGCLRTHMSTSIYYNDEPQILAPLPIPIQMLGEECNSNSSSNNSNAPGKIRTVAARKRNYDSDSDNLNTPAVATILQKLSTPRTLPPKKSKLGRTPARRTSMDSTDMTDCDMSHIVSVGGVGGVGIGNGTATNLVVDNTVGGSMTTEENSAMIVDEVIDSNGVPQRIMTRRMSIRQNGIITDGYH